jgi:hypothetical protein
MFEAVNSAFKKFFTKERVLAIVLFIVLIWALYTYSGSKFFVVDQMGDGAYKQESVNKAAATPNPAAVIPGNNNPVVGQPYALQPVANPSDLLPKDKNSQWGALNPVAMNSGDILMPDLLQAGYHIGLDTIGQTLRNANYQLRSDPIISKSDIGPWNQSTIEPDFGRVPLELGTAPK